MQQLITERMVEMTFAPATDIARWVTRLGLDAHIRESGVVVLKNPHLDFTTAIYDAMDPVTRSVCLASALAGPLIWPQVFPKLLAAVNKEWKARAKVEKGKQKWQAEHPPPATSVPPSIGPVNFETLYRHLDF